jgi:hypothetical protein
MTIKPTFFSSLKSEILLISALLATRINGLFVNNAFILLNKRTFEEAKDLKI